MSISDNTTDMNLNPGDVDSHRTVTLDAGSNSISPGGAVKFDGSGNITHTTANGDDVIGVVRQEAEKGDSMWSVEVFGHVFAAQLDGDSGTDVSPGDTLIASGNDDGAFTGASTSTVQSVDEGGSATYDLYMNHPIALESGSGATTDGELDGDVILAAYR